MKPEVEAMNHYEGEVMGGAIGKDALLFEEISKGLGAFPEENAILRAKSTGGVAVDGGLTSDFSVGMKSGEVHETAGTQTGWMPTHRGFAGHLLSLDWLATWRKFFTLKIPGTLLARRKAASLSDWESTTP